MLVIQCYTMLVKVLRLCVAYVEIQDVSHGGHYYNVVSDVKPSLTRTCENIVKIVCHVLYCMFIRCNHIFTESYWSYK